MNTVTPFMTFLWPSMLWAMLALPVVVALYVFLITRRKKTSLRYASLAMVKDAMGGAALAPPRAAGAVHHLRSPS